MPKILLASYKFTILYLGFSGIDDGKLLYFPLGYMPDPFPQ